MNSIYSILYRVVGYEYSGPQKAVVKSIDFDELEQIALYDDITLNEAITRLILPEPEGYNAEIIDVKKLT